MTVLRRGKKGFTLLEVIVAMAIFAAGIVAISRLFTGSLRLSGGARDASAAAIHREYEAQLSAHDDLRQRLAALGRRTFADHEVGQEAPEVDRSVEAVRQ